MYSKVTAKIKLNQGLKVGTKQGYNLSPTLFNLFINDLPSQFNDNKCDSVRLDEIQVNCLMYADDLVLISRSERGMQLCLSKLTNYCNKWRLSVSIHKTIRQGPHIQN